MCMLSGLLYISTLTAQTNGQIQLLDANELIPIEGATFKYGTQHGVSDHEGYITFVLIKGEIMTLSHLNYGSWKWNESQIRDLIEQKIYYRQTSVETLYPVTIIVVKPHKNFNEEIEIGYQDRMEHDAAAILNQIPAMNSIRKSGNYGFDPVFRGFKSDQLNIVFNGAQSATAACPNRMDPSTSQMAPNMLERVEVLKGPYALRFGTGIGATINFVPVKNPFSEEKNVFGRLSSKYETNGDNFSSEGQIGISDKTYNVSLFGAWSQGNDYEAGNGQTIPSNFKRGSIGANLGFKITSNQKLALSTLYNFARDVDFAALPMDLRNDDTWMFNASHDITVDNEKLRSWNTSVYGSFVDHLMDNLLKPLDPRMMNASTAAKTYNYGARTEGKWSFNKNKLYSGADFRIEQAKGDRKREFLMGPNTGTTVFDNAWQNSQISKTAIFGEFHYSSEKLQYVFSTRLELNQAKVKDPAIEFTQVYSETSNIQFNPNLSLGVLKKFTQTELGLWLGRAQRSGSLTERFINYFPVGQDPYEMVGNPELHPEVNNQMDITFNWNKRNGALNIDVFMAYMQDFISSIIDPNLTPRLPSSPGVRRFVNIDQVFKTGFEINWTQQLASGLQHQLGVAYTYAQDLERDDPLPEIAPLDFHFTLRGNYLQGKLNPGATFRQVLKQPRISEEFGETETPAFSLLDIKVDYTHSKHLGLEIGANNVFDKTYYEHLNRPLSGTTIPIYAPGRSFYASINMNF